MTHTSGASKYLTIAQWNINGLKNKLVHNDFVDIVTKFDICILTETWLNTAVNINGFHEYYLEHKLATKNNGKSGRHSGGIIVAIRKDLKSGMRIVDIQCEYGIWLKIDKTYFKLEKDIYLCAICIPPRSSPYAIKNVFDVLEDQVTTFTSNEMLLMGDFNARTGNYADYIEHDENDHIPVPDNYRNDSKYIETI